MAKRLFVGNLAYSTNEDSLRQAFGQFGTVVEATVVTDRFSGRSKGFGFVEMSSDDEATKAVAELNGKPLDGRDLTVNEARERTERTDRPSHGPAERAPEAPAAPSDDEAGTPAA
jgi:cold-inducible RNA-binding protein